MTTILPATRPELHATGGGWRPFLDRQSQTFYGWCDVDEGCGNPFILDLRSGQLTQCGCPNFRVDPTELGGELGSELAGILPRVDLTPIPRPVGWRYFDSCDPFYGCGYRGGWYFEAITRSVIPCPCGWSPLNLHPWEVGQ